MPNGVLMNLRQAAKHVGGGLTANSLRREIWKGNLPCQKIGGRYLVTDDDLKAMIGKCRVVVSVNRPACTLDAEPVEPQHGQSSTEDPSLTLESARATARKLKNGSPNISPRNTERQPAKVIPIK